MNRTWKSNILYTVSCLEVLGLRFVRYPVIVVSVGVKYQMDQLKQEAMKTTSAILYSNLPLSSRDVYSVLQLTLHKCLDINNNKQKQKSAVLSYPKNSIRNTLKFMNTNHRISHACVRTLYHQSTTYQSSVLSKQRYLGNMRMTLLQVII